MRPAVQPGEDTGVRTAGAGAPTAALAAASDTLVMGLAAGPLWHVLI